MNKLSQTTIRKDWIVTHINVQIFGALEELASDSKNILRHEFIEGQIDALIRLVQEILIGTFDAEGNKGRNDKLA